MGVPPILPLAPRKIRRAPEYVEPAVPRATPTGRPRQLGAGGVELRTACTSTSTGSCTRARTRRSGRRPSRRRRCCSRSSASSTASRPGASSAPAALPRARRRGAARKDEPAARPPVPGGEQPRKGGAGAAAPRGGAAREGAARRVGPQRDHARHRVHAPPRRGACATTAPTAAARERAAWARPKVVLSDASVAGEGEHKIMAHIRAQRTLPGYDADTTHCVYGLDADLVMLALATHEPRFFLLRDFVPIGRLKFLQRCDACGAVGHTPAECHVLRAARAAPRRAGVAAAAAKLPYKPLRQLLDVARLREYLLHLLRPAAFLPAAGDGAAAPPPPRAATASASASAPWWEGERVLDDVVFLTFLVGNDFLPHLPMLPVYTGGLDVALDTYRRVRASLPGYLIDGGDISVAALAPFLRALATPRPPSPSGERRRRRCATAPSTSGAACPPPRAGAAGASGAEAAADASGAGAGRRRVEAARPSAGVDGGVGGGELRPILAPSLRADGPLAPCDARARSLGGLAGAARRAVRRLAQWHGCQTTTRRGRRRPRAPPPRLGASAGGTRMPPRGHCAARRRAPAAERAAPPAAGAVVGEARPRRRLPGSRAAPRRARQARRGQAVVILPFVRVAEREAALAPLQLDDDEAARDRVGERRLLDSARQPRRSPPPPPRRTPPPPTRALAARGEEEEAQGLARWSSCVGCDVRVGGDGRRPRGVADRHLTRRSRCRAPAAAPPPLAPLPTISRTAAARASHDARTCCRLRAVSRPPPRAHLARRPRHHLVSSSTTSSSPSTPPPARAAASGAPAADARSRGRAEAASEVAARLPSRRASGSRARAAGYRWKQRRRLDARRPHMSLRAPRGVWVDAT